MGKLVLIGGGGNGYNKEHYETERIDEAIIGLCERKNPHFLFIGLANGNPDGYYGAMRRIYGKRFGCRTEYLMRQELCDPVRVQKKLNWADIIYSAGGNTLLQLRRFHASGLDRMLTEKFEKSDAVFCGVSAGAICWCAYGASDAYRYKKEPEKLTRLRGLGFADITFCPHYTTERYRKEALPKLLARDSVPVRNRTAFALDYAALEIDGDRYRVIPIDDPKRAAYLCRSDRSGEGIVYRETPLPLDVYGSLTELQSGSGGQAENK